MAYFVPEEELVPADEDLSEPLENLGVVDLLVADELRADEVKNLGANIRTHKSCSVNDRFRRSGSRSRMWVCTGANSPKGTK